MPGHSMRGTLQLEGTIVTCNVLAQGVPASEFAAKLSRLHITRNWCQVDEIRGWYIVFYPGTNIGTPMSVAREKVQQEKLLIIERSLLPPITQKFWGEFRGCILWTYRVKLK